MNEEETAPEAEEAVPQEAAAEAKPEAKPEVESEKKPAPVLVKRAKLDENGTYWGFEEVQALEADEVDAGDGDLKPGAYRWNAEGRFDPLLPQHVRKTEDGVTTSDRVLYDLVLASYLRDPASVPESSIRWCAQFETTIDADLGVTLSYFRKLLAPAETLRPRGGGIDGPA